MAIVYNSTSLVNEIAVGATSTTWAHTCNAADTKLIVASQGRATTSGVTYNGDALTEINSETSSVIKSHLFYLDNPDTGSAYNIVASYSASSEYRSAVATGLSGCDAGIGNNSVKALASYGDEDVSHSLTTSVVNSHAFFCFGANRANQVYKDYTEVIKNTAANWCHYAGYIAGTTAQAYTAKLDIQTSAGTNVNCLAVEIKILPSTTSLKTINGIAIASVKSLNGIAIASVKSVNAIANS